MHFCPSFETISKFLSIDKEICKHFKFPFETPQAVLFDLPVKMIWRSTTLLPLVINEKPSPSCDLFCIEVLKHKETTEDDGAYILVTWVNVLKEGPIEKRFGSPYTIQVSREVLYEDLQKLLMKEMASILHDDILIANQKVCKIRFLSGFCIGY